MEWATSQLMLEVGHFTSCRRGKSFSDGLRLKEILNEAKETASSGLHPSMMRLLLSLRLCALIRFRLGSKTWM